MKTPIRSLAAAILASAIAAAPALSQVTAASTFGPGDSYSIIQGYQVGDNGVTNQSIATGFVYGGPDGYFLSQVRVALDNLEASYTFSFLSGTDLTAATVLESWSLSSIGGISALSSALSPVLSNGMTYWLVASSNDWGGWVYNDQGFAGSAYRQDNGAWVDCPSCVKPAFDVTVSSGEVAVAPEPASMKLVATGLFGVLVAVRKRRIRHA